jgi:hypothetical protein
VAFSEKEEKGDRGKRGQIYLSARKKGTDLFIREKGDGKKGTGKRGQIYLSVIFR